MKKFLAIFALNLLLGSGVFFSTVQADTNNTEVATSSLTSANTEQTPIKEKNFYTIVLLGVGVYPEVSNIENGYNVSGVAGYYLNDVMRLEAGAGAAKSQMSVRNLLFANQRDNFTVNQYQVLLGAKYQLEAIYGTSLKPALGMVLSYTARQYNLLNGLTVNSSDTGSSTAFDIGLSAEAEYELSATYAVGLDFKYMFNVSNQVSANYANPTYGYNGTPIESLQYYIAALSAKMNF